MKNKILGGVLLILFSVIAMGSMWHSDPIKKTYDKSNDALMIVMADSSSGGNTDKSDITLTQSEILQRIYDEDYQALRVVFVDEDITNSGTVQSLTANEIFYNVYMESENAIRVIIADSTNGSGTVPVNYSEEALSLFEKIDFTGYSDSSDWKQDADSLIRKLKADTLWSKIGYLNIYAAPNDSAALCNWIKPDSNYAEIHNSLPFSIDTGYTTNNSGAIDTKFNLATADSVVNGITMDWDKHSIAVYYLNTGENNGRIAGINYGSYGTDLNPRYSGDNNGVALLNSLAGSYASYGINYTTSEVKGFVCNIRNGGSFTLYKNGIELGSRSNSPVYPANLNFYVGALNTGTVSSPQNGIIVSAFMFFRGDLTSTQILKLNNHIEWFMDERGIGVQ